MDEFKKIGWSILRVVLTIISVILFVFMVIWFIMLQIKDGDESIVIDPEGEVSDIENSYSPVMDNLKSGVMKGVDILKKIQEMGK